MTLTHRTEDNTWRARCERCQWNSRWFYSDRAAAQAAMDLHTCPPDQDVHVVTLTGEPGYRTRQALDRLTATLDGDWTVIIATQTAHVIARPADTAPQETRFTPRFTDETAEDAPAPTTTPETAPQRRNRLGRFVAGYGYRLEPR